MLFGHLLTNTAQIFADVRTYWSPAAVQARHRATKLTGKAAGGIIHLINSGAGSAGWHRPAETATGKPAMKPFWEITPEEAETCLEATTWYPAIVGYFRGGGFSSSYLTTRRHAGDHVPHQPGQGAWTGPADRRGLDGMTCRTRSHQILNERTDPTWPTTWFAPNLTGHGLSATSIR